MHDHTAEAPPTRSYVIHWARWYDVLGKIPFLRATRDTLLEVAAPSPGEHVLDVGCGTGTLAIAMKSRVGSGEVRGIDASSEMIEVAREKATKAGAQVDFQVVPMEGLPFADASFDLVTSSLMLHHLPDDVKRQGLAQARRVLKPGGRFLALDLLTQSHSPLHHILGLLGHARAAGTVDTLRPMLKEAGFAEVEVVPTRHKHFVFIRAR